MMGFRLRHATPTPPQSAAFSKKETRFAPHGSSVQLRSVTHRFSTYFGSFPMTSNTANSVAHRRQGRIRDDVFRRRPHPFRYQLISYQTPQRHTEIAARNVLSSEGTVWHSAEAEKKTVGLYRNRESDRLGIIAGFRNEMAGLVEVGIRVVVVVGKPFSFPQYEMDEEHTAH
ncbi:unnamed protein product [Caenorhabditis auriculariae]|uniref:Uncharacterized protein n=1 Tax=Caenorhabditis auriculariae TaxID=2777116 RepID=A0A8S1HC12_9PELO|nr:unnamed protein product [Caenorhabditis auriculariae]